MKVFLLKLVLLLLFLVLLFLILRVLEGIAWYETGLVISRLADPLSLSVRRLKLLLDGRGVSYDGVVEKQELMALVQASGDVVEGELSLLEQEEEETGQTTSFSSGGHFYEEVEDKKDSIWLIQITPRGNEPLLDRGTWKTVVKKVSRFGIRTGTFNCAHDNRFCRQKGWTRPILMLAMPQGVNQKDSVVMAAYPSSSLKTSKVMKWVSARLASTVHHISEGQLVKQWLDVPSSQSSKPPIRLVLLSEVQDMEAPLFFSAIGLKYSGVIRVGHALVHRGTQSLLSEKFGIGAKSSLYLVVTPEGIITYGTGDGEYLNHRAMDIYLRTLCTQANDFFTLSFIVGNMLCLLELVMHHGDVLAKRVCHFLWVWIKYNIVLIMLWLPLLALTQVPLLDPVFQVFQKVLRLSSQTTLASQLRCMWVMHSHHCGWILMAFFMFCAVVCYVRSLYGNDNTNDEVTSSSQWLQSTVTFYYNMLVRPSPGYTSVLMRNARLEEGGNADRLINQPMFPNLFLLAEIPQDYLNNLPKWRYNKQDMTREYSPSHKSRQCSNWHDSFSYDEKHHQENCQRLQDYFKNRDKKLSECKSCAKTGKKGPKSKFCKKFPPAGKRVNALKSEEPCLDSSSQETFDCTCNGKANPKRRAAISLPPVCIGSVTFSSNDIDMLSNNLEFCQTEKSSHETKACGRSVDPEDPSCESNASPPVCECGFDVGQTVDLGSGRAPTFDPWPEDMMESKECSICLEAYVHGTELCGLPCGHAFHQSCVQVWLTTNRHHCCPNCRWPAYKTKGPKLSKHKE